MLTLRQMDSIVHNTLLIFKEFVLSRREEGTNIFYDVHDTYESSKRYLGTYRVWEWHDGSGRSQWVPLDTEDPEITRIRHKVWEAIMAIAVPANQSTEYDTVQLASIEKNKIEQEQTNNDVEVSEIGFDISASFTIPLPWDVLVSASDSCLKGYAPSFVEHEIIKQLPASVTYRIWQNELGELGIVEIRKLGISNSEIHISGVPSNSVDNAPMWLTVKPQWDQRINDTLKGKRELQDQEIEAYLSISNDFDKAKARIKARQKDHQSDVIEAYFNRLVYDLTLWTSNKVIPPPYVIALAGLTEWPDQRMLSQEAREYFEQYKLEISKSVTH
jgi:hypothetical protein